MIAFETIDKLLEKAICPGRTTEEAISHAEEVLGVVFPPTYKYFLSKYGAALCDGREIDGIAPLPIDDATPMWNDVVSHTLRIRKASRGRLPLGYIPISTDGCDYNFYLDTSRRDERGECPVIVLGPGADGVVIGRDFFDFLVKLIENRLKW